MSLLSINHMKKSFDGLEVLKDVSLTVEEGEVLSIIGPSGSGKSTLVQHLNGLLHPQQGMVLVDGADLADRSKAGRRAAQSARMQVGMVFQYPEQQLFEETIAADIAFGPKNQGLEGEELEKRVKEAMELIGLDYETYRDRSPFQLSGGQKRRVAIAGVLALHPKYLVLDEPTAGLDPQGREDLIATICNLHKKWKLTIVFVSHSMEDIARLADSVIIMNHGKVAIKDTPEEVFRHTELLRAAGLKEPRILHLLHRLKAAGVPVRDEAIRLEDGIRAIREVLSNVK